MPQIVVSRKQFTFQSFLLWRGLLLKGKDSDCKGTLNIEQELSFQILFPAGLKKDNKSFIRLIKKPTLQTVSM